MFEHVPLAWDGSWNIMATMVLYTRRYILGNLWPIFKFVVLHSELLMSFPPIVHIKITVSSLLKWILLFDRFHARGSRNPQMLLFVVSPVTSVSELRNAQVKEGATWSGRTTETTIYMEPLSKGVDKKIIRIWLRAMSIAYTASVHKMTEQIFGY